MSLPDSSKRVYAAAKAHAACRGIDLTAWPNQQALVPDEMRWMRAALLAGGFLEQETSRAQS